MSQLTLPRALRRHQSPGSLGQLLVGVFLLPLLAVTPGCGPSGPASTVSGKVTLKNQPVSGSITFVGPDGKEVTGPINPDGTYSLPGPVTGENKIAIKGLPGAGGTPVPPPPSKDAMKDMPGSAAMGVPPPAKYATPGGPDGKLTFNVTKGKQEFNIELKP